MSAPITAPTPEELAARVGWPHESGMRLCGEKDIAAAIRSHSAPLEAQIAELTAERDKAIKERNAFRDTGKAFVAGLGDRLQCADDALAASQERERVMREALSKPGMLVYLDSKTEDAAHVVAFPMQTADIDPDRDLTESAETIYAEAAKLGYGDGCAVWCEFSHFPGQYGDYGMREIAPGFEFVGIDPLLTEMFGGRPPEEDAALQPQETAHG